MAPRIPSFSPDGQWIGYSLGNRLMKVPAQGGVLVPIVVSAAPRGATWSEDGTVVFATMRFAVCLRGGEVKQLTNPSN